MTPQMNRILVPPSPADPVILIPSDNYRRRINIMYRRFEVTIEDEIVIPELFIYTLNTVQSVVCGNGVFVLAGIQFQIELDRKDRIMAIASENASELATNGIEVSVIVEALEGFNEIETTRPLEKGR